MGALVPIKAGGYTDEDPILHTEMNLINTQIVKAPNWVDGDATYTPAVTVTLGGEGLTLNATNSLRFASGGRATWLASSSLVQNLGSNWDLSGDIEFKSGSTTTFEAGAGLEIATTLSLVDGSAVTADGTVTINLGDATTINESGTIYFGPTALVVALEDAQVMWNTGSVFSDGSDRTFSGVQVPSGDSAQTGARVQDLTNGTVTRGAEKDSYYIAHSQGGLLTVKLRSTPAPLVDGAIISFIRESSDGLNATEFQLQDATPFITLNAGAGFARIQFQWRNGGSRWRLYDVNPAASFDFSP